MRFHTHVHAARDNNQIIFDNIVVLKTFSISTHNHTFLSDLFTFLYCPRFALYGFLGIWFWFFSARSAGDLYSFNGFYLRDHRFSDRGGIKKRGF